MEQTKEDKAYKAWLAHSANAAAGVEAALRLHNIDKNANPIEWANAKMVEHESIIACSASFDAYEEATGALLPPAMLAARLGKNEFYPFTKSVAVPEQGG